MRKNDGRILISSEYTHCFMRCVCKESGMGEFSVSDYNVFRCPYCGKGYRTEFVLWVYNPDEKDPLYDDEKWSIENERNKEVC